MAKHMHPLFARYYARTSPLMERRLAGHRRAVLAGLSGRVLDIGAGTGANFAHFPPEVTAVLAVEPEPYLRGIAEAAARQATVPIEVVDGVAERIPAETGSYDAAVCCLVLCSVADPAAALAEIRRVLRPGGQLRFFEHVAAQTTGRRRVQRLLDATIWPIVGAGCHTSRHTAAAIEQAGFTITSYQQLGRADTGMPFPSAPQIIGTAQAPAA